MSELKDLLQRQTAQLYQEMIEFREERQKVQQRLGMNEFKDLLLRQVDQQFLENQTQTENRRPDLQQVKRVTRRQTEQQQESKAIQLPEHQAQQETLATEVEEDKIKLSFGWLDALSKV